VTPEGEKWSSKVEKSVHRRTGSSEEKNVINGREGGGPSEIEQDSQWWVTVGEKRKGTLLTETRTTGGRVRGLNEGVGSH